MGKNKYLGLTIAMSVIALVAVLATVFVAFEFVFTKSLSSEFNFFNFKPAPKEVATVTENANMTNWAIACEKDSIVYYSDGKTGIYMSPEETEEADESAEFEDELLAEGIYSDLCTLGKSLFCVELYSYTEGNQYLRLVKIDLHDGESTVVFDSADTDEEIGYMTITHKIDDKIYFLVNKQLYTTTGRGKVKNVELDGVKKVTNSGIYVSVSDGKGLRLLSFKKDELQTFDSLSDYIVEVKLELDGYLYLALSQDEESNKVEFVKLDMLQGTYTSLPYQKAYGTLDNLNYYDGQIYMTFYKRKKCYVCKIDATSDSRRVTHVKTVNSPVEKGNTISIAGDTIFVYPITTDKPITIPLPKKQAEN